MYEWNSATSKYFTAKTLRGPRLPSCTLHHDWSVGNGASMMRVNSTYGRTYSTVYTVCYNIMYYIILSTDLPDGRMSPIRMSHYDTGSDSLESTLGVKADSSTIIQVHQDTLRTLDTGYIQNSYCTVSAHNYQTKYGIMKTEYCLGWHRGVHYIPSYTWVKPDTAFIKPPVTVCSTMVCHSTVQYKPLHKM